MRRIRLDAAARDAFLADRRLGILILHDEQGAPIGRPLWYGWDGREVEMFSEWSAAKLRQLERDPRVSLLVTNIPPEPARWVSLEGRVAVDPLGGQETAARLPASASLRTPSCVRWRAPRRTHATRIGDCVLSNLKPLDAYERVQHVPTPRGMDFARARDKSDRLVGAGLVSRAS